MTWDAFLIIPQGRQTKSLEIPLDRGPHIVEAKRGEPLKAVKPYTAEVRREIDWELADRGIDCMKRQKAAGKPFFLYLPISRTHFPNLPSKRFEGQSRIGQFGDCLMEGDAVVGKMLDALRTGEFWRVVFVQPMQKGASFDLDAAKPAHTRTGSTDRMMDRDELRAVGERSLDLDLVDHLGDAFHDVVTPQNRLARLHQLRDRTAVADTLEDVGGDEGDGLRVIELEAASTPAPRHFGGGEDQELLLLPGREVHRRTSFLDR